MKLNFGDSGSYQRGKHSAAQFRHSSVDARMAVRGDDFVCLPDEDGLKHIDDPLNLKIHGQEHGDAGFRHRRFRESSPEPSLQGECLGIELASCAHLFQ